MGSGDSWAEGFDATQAEQRAAILEATLAPILTELRKYRENIGTMGFCDEFDAGLAQGKDFAYENAIELIESSVRQEEVAVVPRRWMDEVVLALQAATTINERTLRTGRVEGLDNGNHDRLIEEAKKWSPYA